MKVQLLLNTNNVNINSLSDCKTKTELFAFMIKTHIKKLDEQIELSINKCFPCTEMKSTFKKKTINNFKKVDHIIFLDDSGFYRKHMTFINHLKKYSSTISTICEHSKFYNGEDAMFIYNNLLTNKNIHYIPTPLDENIYTSSKLKNTIYILLDKNPDKFILNQIYNLISVNYLNNEISFIIGVINKTRIDFINISVNGNSDVFFNITKSIRFNSYMEYISELSKANLFISANEINKINDIYLLYELAMCNTLNVSKQGLIERNIIDELDLCIFDESIEINWREVFTKLDTYNIREKLITNHYTWENALKLILYQLNQILPSNKNNDRSIQIDQIKKGYCLNIISKNRPVIVNLDDIHKKRIEANKSKSTNTKKRVLLQSELLKQ